MSPCAASPGEILLTLDLAVATQILMQLSVRDICQLTDIQGAAVSGLRGTYASPANTGRTCSFLARQAREPLLSQQVPTVWTVADFPGATRSSRGSPSRSANTNGNPRST